MKNILLLSFVSALLFTSCDYVDNPKPYIKPSDTAGCYFPPFPKLTTHVKKFLIEDYTGHKCPNCPIAAATLHTVKTNYPGRIIDIGIHVTDLASPVPGSYPGAPDGAFKADYNVKVGTTYDDFFLVSKTLGLPSGMISRKDYNESTKTHVKPPSGASGWNTYLSGVMIEQSVVDLQIAVDFNTITRKICFAVKDSFLANISDDPLKLVVLLVQDSITDYQVNFSTVIPDYTHQNVLRDAITPNGAWGESLVSGSIPAGTTHTKYFGYTLPEAYKNVICEAKDCHLIAFIYKAKTYEIIQVEEVKLIE